MGGVEAVGEFERGATSLKTRNLQKPTPLSLNLLGTLSGPYFRLDLNLAQNGSIAVSFWSIIETAED
jgi:hypothetical protein